MRVNWQQPVRRWPTPRTCARVAMRPKNRGSGGALDHWTETQSLMDPRIHSSMAYGENEVRVRVSWSRGTPVRPCPGFTPATFWPGTPCPDARPGPLSARRFDPWSIVHDSGNQNVRLILHQFSVPIFDNFRMISTPFGFLFLYIFRHFGIHSSTTHFA